MSINTLRERPIPPHPKGWGLLGQLVENGKITPACKAFKPKGDGITTCVCCGRKLTHPESVKDGMGPICSGKARRYGGYHETNCKD